jgi:hypothetical protein
MDLHSNIFANRFPEYTSITIIMFVCSQISSSNSMHITVSINIYKKFILKHYCKECNIYSNIYSTMLVSKQH